MYFHSQLFRLCYLPRFISVFLRLAALLELLSRKNAAKKLSRVLSNIVIGSVELRRKDFQGKICRVFFKNEKSEPSDGLQCQPQKRKVLCIVHLISYQNTRKVHDNQNSLDGVLNMTKTTWRLSVSIIPYLVSIALLLTD